MKKVAVVILNYNGRRYLEQFLPSVLRSTYENYEVYVADNASKDDSVNFLKRHYPQVSLLIFEENYGFAGGYNHALKQIEADYYVLLNSDVEVTPNWINPIIELMDSDKTIAACQPKIRMFARKELFEHAGASGGWIDNLGYPFCRGRIFTDLEVDEGQYEDSTEIFWATGAAMFIRSECYHKAQGLDADYFAHMEEIDLCWRLKRAGYKIMACPKSIVFHVGGGTLPAINPLKTYLNFRNSLATLLKNEPVSKLLWLFPLRLILDGVAGVRFLTEGKFSEIWAIVKAHWVVFLSFFSILKKRKATNKIVEDMRIGKMNKAGLYSGSIVWDFFVGGKRKFSSIIR